MCRLISIEYILNHIRMVTYTNSIDNVCVCVCVCVCVKSDLILKILNRHSRFYRYDAHDTILLNHIHFGSLLVVRRRF